MTKTHITLLLIKKDVVIDNVLIGNYKSIDLDGGQKLYYKETTAVTPKWVTTFLESDNVAKVTLKIQTISAVMLFKRRYDEEERIFAVTFGFGRNLINQDVIENRFGLITTLSSIGKERIRSLDLSSLETVLLNSRIQASSLSGIENFSIDFNKDLLKAVTGKLGDDRNAGSLTGKDSLSFSSVHTYNTIGEDIDKHYRSYISDKYKDSFKWIDKIQDVKEKAVINKLDGIVVDNINSNQLDNIWIAYPDIINWKDLDHFKFGREDYIEDVDILLVRNELIKKDDDKVTVDTLKSRKIHAYDYTDNKIANWSLYKCLYVECPLDDKQYFLQEGKWFIIESDFVKEVNTFYNNTPIYEKDLHDYNYRTEKEFNEKIVEDSNGSCFLMDRKLQKADGDDFELCDIITSDKELLHVKKFTSSAVLSHLFNQGLVSAECIKDINIRRQANGNIADEFKLDETEPFNLYKVVYIIARKNATERPQIPFFSKVAFRNVANRLLIIGYQYAIKGVNFTYVVPDKEKRKKTEKLKM